MLGIAGVILASAALVLAVAVAVVILVAAVGVAREKRASLEAQRRADRAEEITSRAAERVLASKIIPNAQGSKR